MRNDTAQPQRNPVLQISSTLEWNSITVAGKTVQYLAQTYTSDIDHSGGLSEAIVTLPQPVPPQGTVEIEIAYSGKIPQDSARLTRIGVPAERAAHSELGPDQRILHRRARHRFRGLVPDLDRGRQPERGEPGLRFRQNMAGAAEPFPDAPFHVLAG